MSDKSINFELREFILLYKENKNLREHIAQLNTNISVNKNMYKVLEKENESLKEGDKDGKKLEKLNYELGDILNDLSEWMNQTSLCQDPENVDTFEYIFQQVKSIKSFTNDLKNYKLVKKN